MSFEEIEVACWHENIADRPFKKACKMSVD